MKGREKQQQREEIRSERKKGYGKSSIIVRVVGMGEVGGRRLGRVSFFGWIGT